MKVHVYVRAIDGALYRNPKLTMPGAFVQFALASQAEGPPKALAFLIRWRVRKPDEGYLGPEEMEPPHTYLEMLGIRHKRLAKLTVREAVVPDGTDPPRIEPADLYVFDLDGEIPQPSHHEGFERYDRNCQKDGVVLQDQ